MPEDLTSQTLAVTESLRQASFEESDVAISALAGLVNLTKDDYSSRIIFSASKDYIELSSYRFRGKDDLLETSYAGMLIPGLRLVLDNAFPGVSGPHGSFDKNAYFGDGHFVVRALPLVFAFQHRADLSVATLEEASSTREKLYESIKRKP